MNETIQTEQTQKVNRTAVAVYYIIACAFSWPFFWWRDMHTESWQHLGIPGFIKTWSYMWGPGISALICLYVFRKSHKKTITFFGTSVYKSLLFYFMPILALSIPGASVGIDDVNPHLAPWILGVLGFISILGEELGWRGFLQDALAPVKPVYRFMLIGAMWELWHFTNRMGHGELQQIVVRVAIMMAACIVLSVILGIATDRSKSIMVAVTLHAWVDILADGGSPATYIVFGLSVPFWFFMLRFWNKKTEVA